MRRLLSLLLVITPLLACRADTEVLSPRDAVNAHSVTVRFVQTGLRVENGTEDPIYWFAVEQRAAALILWAPCSDPARCDRIDARSSKIIPFDRIAIWKPEAEAALFYWWRLVPAESGQFKPDMIRTAGATR